MRKEHSKGARFKDVARTETAVRIKYLMDNGLMKNVDAGNSQAEVAEKLQKAFLFAYEYGHRDHTRMSKKDDHGRVFRVEDLDEKAKGYLNEVFTKFAKTYYNENGAMRPELRERFPEAVGSVYKTLVDKSPLAHTEFILGALLVEIGRGDKAEAANIFPNGIDFSRADSHTRKQKENLAQRAADAISDKKIAIETPPWKHPASSCVTIGGLRFLSYKAHDTPCLVTQSGALVEQGAVQRQIEQYLEHKGNPDAVDIALTTPSKTLAGSLAFDHPDTTVINGAGLLNGTSKKFTDAVMSGKNKGIDTRIKAVNGLMGNLKHISGAPTIDGTDAAACQARLVCLDADMLTGLRMDEKNNELQRFRQSIEGKTVDGKTLQGFADLIPEDYRINTLLSHDEGEKSRFLEGMRKHIAQSLATLRETAPEDIKPLFDKAAPNLCLHLPRIYAMSDKAFVGENGEAKRPPHRRKPQAYFTQGGTASGKSRLHDFARSELGEAASRNLVMASLDDARFECDQYWLCVGAGHHGDDYKRFEQFGKALRSLTEKRARLGHFDYLRDSTFIPFEQGGNDKIAQAFKQAGYETTVLAAARPLYVFSPEKRLRMESHGTAYGEALVQARLREEQKLRAAIIPVIVDTHTKFPVAANDAKRSLNVDRHITFDTSVPRNEGYVLAFTVDVGKRHGHDLLDKLLGKENGELLTALEHEGLLPEAWEKIRPMSSHAGRAVNFKVIRNDGYGRHRIEVITDMDKYIGAGMLEKGLLHRQERGPEALYEHRLPFDIMGQLQRPGEKHEHTLNVNHTASLETRIRRIEPPINNSRNEMGR